MKKIFMVVLVPFLFIGCKKDSVVCKKMQIEKIREDCMNISTMELKSLEIYPQAIELFEVYKTKKINIVISALSGEKNDEELSAIKDITRQFNKITLSVDDFDAVDKGYATNPYLDIFNSALLKEIIMNANENETIDLNKLQCIYRY